MALRAGVFDGAALPMAIGAEGDLLDQDMFLVVPPAARQAPRAATGFAFERRRAFLGARAVASGAACRSVEVDFFLAPAGDSLKGHEQFHLDVFSPPWASASAVKEPFKRAAAAEIEIETSENVFKINAPEQVLAAETGHSCEAAAIILLAFFGVGKDSVGFGNFLEALLGTRFLVAVGMVF